MIIRFLTNTNRKLSNTTYKAAMTLLGIVDQKLNIFTTTYIHEKETTNHYALRIATSIAVMLMLRVPLETQLTVSSRELISITSFSALVKEANAFLRISC